MIKRKECNHTTKENHKITKKKRRKNTGITKQAENNKIAKVSPSNR